MSDDSVAPIHTGGVALRHVGPRDATAFVADLHGLGLLDTTLVVALGEFGRTPRIGLVTQTE